MSVAGMPPLEVSRRIDGRLVINDGVTRATRVAKFLPDTTVTVKVIGMIPFAVGGGWLGRMPQRSGSSRDWAFCPGHPGRISANLWKRQNKTAVIHDIP